MLNLTGEIRGIRSSQFRDGIKHYLIMEDEALNTYKIGLSDDHVKSGFVNQINSLKGRKGLISLSCGTYQNTLFYRYEGMELPRVSEPKKAA